MTERPKAMSDPNAQALLENCRSRHPVRYDVEAGLERHHRLVAAGVAAPDWSTPADGSGSAGGTLGSAKVLWIGSLVLMTGIGIAAIWHGRGDRPVAEDTRAHANPSPAGAGPAFVESRRQDPASGSSADRAGAVAQPSDAIGSIPGGARSEGSRSRTRAVTGREPAGATVKPEAALEEPAERVIQKDAVEREMREVATAERWLQVDAARALALARAGEQRFPNGYFRQERLYIAVSALARLGRMQEARIEADRLLRQYPNSPFRQRVQKALAGQ